VVKVLATGRLSVTTTFSKTVGSSWGLSAAIEFWVVISSVGKAKTAVASLFFDLINGTSSLQLTNAIGPMFLVLTQQSVVIMQIPCQLKVF
jgi:hypothetical protein